LQQYLDGVSKNSLLPEVNLTTKLSTNLYKVFDRCTLGEPRMSFADAKLTDAPAAGKVTMNVGSGREITLDYSVTDTPKVQIISQITAVDGPVLEIDLPFANLQEATYVGVLGVDLSAGTQYTLSSGQSADESIITGAFFKTVFQSWPADKKQWVINRVARSDSAVGVENFFMRVQAAPGAKVRTAENYGDGAVVVFLQMKDGEVGTFPAAENQLHYLIPSDGEQFTATTIISARRFLRAISQTVFADSNTNAVAKPIEFADGNSDLEIRASTGAIRRWSGVESTSWGTGPNGSAPIETYEFWYEGDPLRGEDSYDIRTNGQCELILTLLGGDRNGRARFKMECYLRGYIENFASKNKKVAGAPVKIHQIAINQSAGNSYAVYLVSDMLYCGYQSDSFVSIYNPDNVNVTPPELFNGAANVLIDSMGSDMPNRVVKVPERDMTLELSPLNNFLLSGPYATTLTDFVAPYDVAMFGHLAQRSTTYSITTPLHSMAHGTTHTFAISPASLKVSWSVANLPGENFPKGTINATTGAYTAPAAEEIEGLQLRVKVTAVVGTYSTSALVTILRKPVNINPRIQFIGFGASCDLSAGALPGLAKTWSTVAADQGTLTTSPVENREKRFTAPAKKAGVAVEVVPITVTAGGKSENAYVVVTHEGCIVNVAARDFNIRGQTVQLGAAIPSLPLPLTFTWTVVAGSGSISASGLLTADQDPVEPFVLVFATADLMGYPVEGYICLPLPLAPFPLHETLPINYVPTYVLGDGEEVEDDADHPNAAG
jgi:hypothetical protein